jgi:hypothetical protein
LSAFPVVSSIEQTGDIKVKRQIGAVFQWKTGRPENAGAAGFAGKFGGAL